MRTRPVLVLVAVVLIMIGAGVYVLLRPTGAQVRAVGPGPEETGRAYLASWQDGDLSEMGRMVVSPPADFAQRHLDFAQDLDIESVRLVPGTLVRGDGLHAELPFHGVRKVRNLGDWPFESTLRMVLREGRWRVVWLPETLHPALAGGGRIAFKEIPAPETEPVTGSGAPLPQDSGAEGYRGLFGAGAEETTGYALEATAADGSKRELAVFRPTHVKKLRTSLSRPVQAAAARALDGVDHPAAIVAVRPGTGEVLAVADRLGEGNGGQSAFRGLYPPGPAFKVVTATALLSEGLTPATRVGCPRTYTPPKGRIFRNAADHPASEAVTLTTAFALSCDTAFVEQAAAHLPSNGRGLVRAAELFGFNAEVPGLGESCGRITPPGDVDELASDAIGQGSVVASPLCMALVAAAVQDGSWHGPVLVPSRSSRVRQVSRRASLPEATVTALRSMMRAAVADTTGTSDGAVSADGTRGLPPGTAGKAGTARAADGREHAWFVGYRGDLAFAVLVENGGEAAVPVAARFLRAL
ncbi:penicillin-binding transpeptidase domain-containing protein [Streptosporangium jomthongense]|uniref:Penicillin-binding transpeptidase domain-containing protein n=1 Tax=Streptosporangium jomthongense TaxID=1193683 RepID=A0ABV8EUB2_9ACTN